MPDPDVRLNAILRHLICQSFPRLRRRVITIEWGGGEDLLYYAVHSGQHRIVVNESLRGAGRSVLEGGITHELCHIDADLRLGLYQRLLSWEKYSRSRWYRMKEERSTEHRIIDLGYGKSLLDLLRYGRRLGYSFEREHGLLYVEVLRAINTKPCVSATI